jgi:hypothetical protein
MLSLIAATGVRKAPLRPSKCKICHVVGYNPDTLSVRRQGE